MLLIGWFALVTPLGCALSSLFNSSFSDVGTVTLRVLSILMNVVHFLGSVFLTNCGMWFFFELAVKKSRRKSDRLMTSEENDLE